nr:MAG TPA: hypothetical protein [Caudoviricetes sp.]
MVGHWPSIVHALSCTCTTITRSNDMYNRPRREHLF